MKKETKDAEPPSIDKKRAQVDKYVQQIKKELGKDVSIGIASEMDLRYDFLVPPIPSLASLMSPDADMQGGFPVGKFSVLAGPEKSGKTTLCLQTLAADQVTHPNDLYAWVDTENSFDEPYARKLGIDMDRLLMIKNGIMHDVLNRIVDLSKMGVLRAVVVDSIGGLTPKTELESSKGDEHGLEKDHMLDLQRKMGQFHRMINPFVARNNCAVLLITHVYQDPGMQGAYRVKGGNALKHWGHVRLMISRVNDQSTKQKITMPDGQVKEVFTGHDVIIRLDKTRQNSKETQSVVVPYRYGIGLDVRESTISVAIHLNIIEKAGTWYKYNDEKWQGKKNIIKYFQDQAMYDKLVNDVLVNQEMKKDNLENDSEVNDGSFA